MTSSSVPASVHRYVIDPQIAAQLAQNERPLAVIDLDACSEDFRFVTLPACPLIGIGDPGHALASALDCVIEAPISIDAVIRGIETSPRTAAALVHLLRALEGVAVEPALALESMCYGLLQGSEEYATWLAARPPLATVQAQGSVRVERDADVLHVVLDRPQARNAIDRAMRDQLYEAFMLAVLDEEIREVKLRAAGKVFSIGGDLDEFGTTRDPATAHWIRRRTLPANALALCRDRVVVHVQGGCIGAGLEIAAMAARFSATSNAWFQLPEVSMGLIPGAGGCVSVPRRIGRQRAALMMLSGRRIDALTALSWGLIDAIEDPASTDES